MQDGTRSQREPPHASHVLQARIQQPSGPHCHQHAKVVRQAPARLKGTQSASAMPATLEIQEAPALHASQESGKVRQELAAATLAR